MIARLRTLASKSPLRPGDVLEIHVPDSDDDSPMSIQTITTLDDFVRRWAHSATELQGAELDTKTAFVGAVHPDGAYLYPIAEVYHA